MDYPQENFWHFSNHVYRCPGVSDACLKLQNDAAADVNLLLFACWYGATRGAIPDILFTRINNFSGMWTRQVVRPLRGARGWMKKASTPGRFSGRREALGIQYEKVREQIKTVELQAEHFQQNLLEALVETGEADLSLAEQRSHICSNLELYLGNLPSLEDPEALQSTRLAVRLLCDSALAVCQV